VISTPNPSAPKPQRSRAVQPGPAANRWVGSRSLARLACGLALLLSGCGEAPLPERDLRSDDCLRDLQLDSLAEQIRRCDQVVARFPGNPAPLNERYLLLSLAGQDRKACADIDRANALVGSASPGSVDPQLRLELQLRAKLCGSPARQ
jgi:hypothetical protein